MRRQLVVLARWPAAGRCKRRLAQSCGSAPAAARVQAALTLHTLAVAMAWAGNSEAGLTLAVDGLGARARRRWAAALGVEHSCSQGGGGLGSRMQRQLLRSFNGGADQVVLIGSDLPGLESADLDAAFGALADAPLVLGPAADGGYWLIGLNRAGFARAGAALMCGPRWGGEHVLADTELRAASMALPAVHLRQQNDLDCRADLAPWLRRAPRP